MKNDEKPIKTLKREHHLNHLVNMSPIIVFAFTVQCFLINKFNPEASISEFSIPLAMALGLMIFCFSTYDSKHKIDLYADYMHVSFSLLNIDLKIPFAEITEIQTLDPEAEFSTVIVFRGEKRYTFYFLDEPATIENFVREWQDAKVSEKFAA